MLVGLLTYTEYGTRTLVKVRPPSPPPEILTFPASSVTYWHWALSPGLAHWHLRSVAL